MSQVHVSNYKFFVFTKAYLRSEACGHVLTYAQDRFPDIFIGNSFELEAMCKIQYICDGLNGQYQ